MDRALARLIEEHNRAHVEACLARQAYREAREATQEAFRSGTDEELVRALGRQAEAVVAAEIADLALRYLFLRIVREHPDLTLVPDQPAPRVERTKRARHRWSWAKSAPS